MKAWFNACVENIKNVFRGSSVNPTVTPGFHELSIAPMNIREVHEESSNVKVPTAALAPYELTAVPSIFELAAASQGSVAGGPPSPFDLTADAEHSEETSIHESTLPGSVPATSEILVENAPTPIPEEIASVSEETEAVPEEAVAKEAFPEEAVAEEAVPEEAVAEEAVAEEAVAEEVSN